MVFSHRVVKFVSTRSIEVKFEVKAGDVGTAVTELGCSKK